MKYVFVFDISWSVTDNDTVIIQETCEATARARIKSAYPNIKTITLVRKIDSFNWIE